MSEDPDPALVAFVAALVDAGATLHQLLSHMEAYGAAEDAPPPEEVLAVLVHGVLAPVFDPAGDGSLASAAGVLDRAMTAVADEVLLVGPEVPPACAGRQRRRR